MTSCIAVPKVSLRWFPINDEFAVRASYSESFSAASLFSLFGPSGVGFTDQPVGGCPLPASSGQRPPEIDHIVQNVVGELRRRGLM